MRCRAGSVRYLQSYLAQKELSCEPIWEFTGVLLMARSHPLASFGAVTSDSLAEYIELRRGNETALGFFEEPQQEDTGVRIYGCAGAEALLSRMTGSYMIVPPAPKSAYEKSSLIQKTYSEGLRYTDLLIYPKDSKLSELSSQFVDLLYMAKNAAVFSV